MTLPDVRPDVARSLTGLPVTNQDAEQLGRVRSVLVDVRSLRPSWVLVEHGRIRKRLSPVPLAEALVGDQAILVPYTADDLRLAPGHKHGEPLHAALEQQLVDHYNLGFGTSGTTGPHTGVPAAGKRVTQTAGAVPAEAAMPARMPDLRRLRHLTSA